MSSLILINILKDAKEYMDTYGVTDYNIHLTRENNYRVFLLSEKQIREAIDQFVNNDDIDLKATYKVVTDGELTLDIALSKVDKYWKDYF
jgi:hypothetical protein